MNQAQKKGVGSLIAIGIATAGVICEMAGVPMPSVLVTIFSVVPIVAGIFGIVVNLPANTK